MFQVFARYFKTGNEFPVREPHASRAGASWHVQCAMRARDQRDAKLFSYCYREVIADTLTSR